MAKKQKLPSKPTHRAVLATGETVDYYGPPFGAHPTAWSFGGVDKDGKADGSPVRVVPVASKFDLALSTDDQELREELESIEDEDE